MMLSGMAIPREVPPNTVSGKFPPGSGPEGMRKEDNSIGINTKCAQQREPAVNH